MSIFCGGDPLLWFVGWVFSRLKQVVFRGSHFYVLFKNMLKVESGQPIMTRPISVVNVGYEVPSLGPRCGVPLCWVWGLPGTRVRFTADFSTGAGKTVEANHCLPTTDAVHRHPGLWELCSPLRSP